MSFVTHAALLKGAQKSSREPEVLERPNAPTRLIQVAYPSSPVISEHHAVQATALEAAGTPIGGNDLWIACHALVENATLVTNVREFERVDGLSLENWAALIFRPGDPGSGSVEPLLRRTPAGKHSPTPAARAHNATMATAASASRSVRCSSSSRLYGPITKPVVPTSSATIRFSRRAGPARAGIASAAPPSARAGPPPRPRAGRRRPPYRPASGAGPDRARRTGSTPWR